MIMSTDQQPSHRVSPDATPPKPTSSSSTSSSSNNAFRDSLQRFQYAVPSHFTSTRRITRQSSYKTPATVTPADSKKRPLEREPDDTDTNTTNSPKRKKRQTLPPLTSTSSPHQRPKKSSSRKSSSYAPPSTYAHLSPIPDILAPNLISIFIGTNPGIQTSTTGHIYAHPSNLFWKLLFLSGCTDATLLKPTDDYKLPTEYSLGNTNIVSRPTRDAGELSKQEMIEGAEILEKKMRKWKPESVCVVGKGIWEAVWRWKHDRKIKKEEFKWGWQDESENMGMIDMGEEEEKKENWKGARVFVATSTSGLSASLKPAEKEAIWKPFGEWVRKRRAERAAASSSSSAAAAAAANGNDDDVASHK